MYNKTKQSEEVQHWNAGLAAAMLTSQATVKPEDRIAASTRVLSLTHAVQCTDLCRQVKRGKRWDKDRHLSCSGSALYEPDMRGAVHGPVAPSEAGRALDKAMGPQRARRSTAHGPDARCVWGQVHCPVRLW